VDQAVLDTVLPKDPRQQKIEGSAATGTALFPNEGLRFKRKSLSGSAHEAATWQERAIRTVQQFPQHWLRTNLTCVVPAIAGTLAIFVTGAHPQRMTSELPHITATFEQFEYLTEVRSSFSLGLESFNWVLIDTLTVTGLTSVLCAMVAGIIGWGF
jgi:hypothetical protein